MIEPADLVWRDGRPFSPGFNDIYHDAADMAAAAREVERVFLAPAGLDDLLAGQRHLVIAELGFGTGLNFAVCARRAAAAGVRLHFVSVDAAPIAPDAFADICAARCGAEPVYAELIGQYPPLLPGWHQRRLCGGRVRLSVFWGDAATGLEQLAGAPGQPVDIWLLDGFAPDRNPAMWTPALMKRVGSVARTGSRVTTFTAAGRVRRALEDAGFRMRRIDQRPHKRETLAGTFVAAGRRPWTCPTTVHVVGGGLAGAAAARALAEWDMEVVVREAAREVAAGASSIPVTVMHPRLHHDGSDNALLKATAYAHAVAATRELLHHPDGGLEPRGALQVAAPNFPEQRLIAVADRYRGTGLGLALLDPADATELAGVRIAAPALWFPDACLVNAPRLTRTLLSHPGIDVHTGSPATHWPDAPTVLACGTAARSFPGAEFLELAAVHGQLDLVRPGATTTLQVPLIGGGYAVPAGDGILAVGATYEHTGWEPSQASERNIDRLQRLVCCERDAAHPVEALRATRCVSSDRNPVLGPLYDLSGTALPGRLVSTGHGSMGTVTSHLGAAVIHSLITGAVPPLTPPLAHLTSPLRFRARQARRGYRMGATE